MATISAAMVKDLREKTGAGMMDCKNALNETAGDIEAAVDWLRKKGITKAAKKSGRVAAEGLVAALVDGKRGVVVEVNSETDFVARNADFQALVKDVAKVALKQGGDVEGVLKAQASAGGTVQEVFQDACENYYADESSVAPMVLVGTAYWTEELPAWPLLRTLAHGRPMEAHVHLVDDVDEAAALFPTAAG